MRAIIILAVSVLLAGCVTSGTKVDEAKLSQFERGKTTYGEVMTSLGQPSAVSTLSDGRKVAVYSYVHSQARPETFIPIIGPLVGGADAQATRVTLQFDTAGVLQSYSSTQSQSGVGMGLAGGK
jgi:outer membrane protein assembly factor BamE (lipoprotein component of BamABCDE complex)